MRIDILRNNLANSSLIDMFDRNGMLELPNLLGKEAAADLYKNIHATRAFDQSLFLTEEEWENGPKTHQHTNPRQGRNILEHLKDNLAFVESDSHLLEILEQLLGRNFRWLSKKIVCRLDYEKLPAWVQHKIAGTPANTLNAFMRPEYRDISCYLENDLHQDIQDYPRIPLEYREHRLISLYVHLEEITTADAPVILMPGTHRFGATAYQHQIRHVAGAGWEYRDESEHSMMTTLHPVIGGPGHVALWHSCLLHGARPVKHGKPRLVLRYMLARSLDDPRPCGLDAANANIIGPLYPDRDYSAGAHANADGSWNLRETDFTRLV